MKNMGKVILGVTISLGGFAEDSNGSTLEIPCCKIRGTIMAENYIRACKQAAVQFLHLIMAGQIDEAYRRYVDLHGKHHNPFFPEGFPALKKAMIENHAQFPNKQLTVKNLLGDGSQVAVHSHIVLRPGETGISAVHLFRFEGNRIVEMWDCGQPVPADSPNKDGAF
ncbi:MAG: nuclear transport factor 2 family protein [Candidatus Methanoperedens sp.]|nr:nuclear transport factor 2 family protein [Candidatus Methanoperedens sp.]